MLPMQNDKEVQSPLLKLTFADGDGVAAGCPSIIGVHTTSRKGVRGGSLASNKAFFGAKLEGTVLGGVTTVIVRIGE